MEPYCIAECLTDIGGWSIGMLQSPKGLHFQMGQRQVDEIDSFVKDLKTAMKLVAKDPKKYYKGNAAMYGGVASMPDRSLVAQSCNTYVEMMSMPVNEVQTLIKKL